MDNIAALFEWQKAIDAKDRAFTPHVKFLKIHARFVRVPSPGKTFSELIYSLEYHCGHGCGYFTDGTDSKSIYKIYWCDLKVYDE